MAGAAEEEDHRQAGAEQVKAKSGLLQRRRSLPASEVEEVQERLQRNACEHASPARRSREKFFAAAKQVASKNKSIDELSPYAKEFFKAFLRNRWNFHTPAN